MSMKLLSKDECTALRSLAILSIVLHNFSHWLPGAAKENEFAYSIYNSNYFYHSIFSSDFFLHLFSFWGHLGVPVFIFLSAYGLSLKYDDKQLIEKKDFLLTHYKKLFYPLLYGTIVYLIVIYMKEGYIDSSIPRFITQCTMLLNLIYPYEQNLAPGPYWYFSMTMQLYLIYLFIVHRRSMKWLLILTLISIIFIGGLYYHHKLLIWAKYNVSGWLLPFTLGIIAVRRHFFIAIFSNKMRNVGVFFITSILLFAFSFNYYLWIFIPLITVFLAISIVRMIPAILWNNIHIIGENSLYLFVVHPIIRPILIPFAPNLGNYWALLIYLVATITMAVVIAKRKWMFLLPLLLVLSIPTIWGRIPLKGNGWSKQTIYVGVLDVWHGASTDEKAHALWIDDDSSEGVFTVKRIADEIGIRPAFAVIADRMKPEVADSLAAWQRQGAGIVLHGLRHERWKEWDKSQIENDIRQSYRRLYEQGFDTAHILKLIIPPHGCNTSVIRQVIKQQGCQMISGASLVNPDRHVFQLGRIAITPQTNIEEMRQFLEKAYQRKAFVIFSTHSSIPTWFSEKKSKEVLKIAKEIGFDFTVSE